MLGIRVTNSNHDLLPSSERGVKCGDRNMYNKNSLNQLLTKEEKKITYTYRGYKTQQQFSDESAGPESLRGLKLQNEAREGIEITRNHGS
jgi:hypothetical protein